MREFEYNKEYDVIVIGAGHAGCEAGLAAARMGCCVLVLTLNVDNVAMMSCNPAIGGLAKGQLVREIDALGGEMARAIDKTGIQFRMLNKRKGPAVWAPRAQADKQAYRLYLKRVLEEQERLDLKQGLVSKILVKDNIVNGVRTKTGTVYKGKTVILATGTFMKGVMHIGHTSFKGGRSGEISAEEISESLKELGLEIGRLKTGTTPRLDSSTIDYSKTEEQPGDVPAVPFSYETVDFKPKQVCCYLTYTNESTHKIIRDCIKESALYSGNITGVGPRYCPSIEDKVIRFADKTRHQIFLEPEGTDTLEVYCNGFSSSLSEEVQIRALRTIPGLENVEIIRPAYAIEYDFVYQYQMKNSLETKKIDGLFLAGQINGTSGYEEAAAQGIMAGINAVRLVRGDEPLILSRSQAYIGVLIDDLVTKGTQEPYRMFTSRAEYRLLLRQDNADERLRPLGYKLGLISDEVFEKFRKKYQKKYEMVEKLKSTPLMPSACNTKIIERMSGAGLKKKTSLAEVLKRPEITLEKLREEGLWDEPLSKEIEEIVEIEIKYEGYIKRQREQIRAFEKSEALIIPVAIEYGSIQGLTNEAKEKLKKFQPRSLGQASRISGITPADISVLMVHIIARGKTRSGDKSAKKGN